MDELNRKKSEVENFQSNLGVLSRLIALLVGLCLVTIGIFYSLRTYNKVSLVLQNPQSIEQIINDWEKVIGEDTTKLIFDKFSITFGRAVAIGVLGLGGIVLAVIALIILGAGIKIILWTNCDREVIKKILIYTFGRNPRDVKRFNELSKNIDSVSNKSAQ